MGEIAKEGSMRGGKAVVIMFMDDAATSATLVGHATSFGSTAVLVATSTV
jgi:hypothetical protein